MKTAIVTGGLSGVLNRRDPHVRIRTYLEISWDRIFYTVDEEPASLRITPAPLMSARLFFRGFSRMTRASPGGPQVFVHDDVEARRAGRTWRACTRVSAMCGIC